MYQKKLCNLYSVLQMKKQKTIIISSSKSIAIFIMIIISFMTSIILSNRSPEGILLVQLPN